METASRLVFTFLLNSLWQISLIAAAAWLAARLLRNGPAAHRHAVWAAALLASFAVPLIGLRPAAPLSARPSIAPDFSIPAASQPAETSIHSTPRSAATPPRAISYAPSAAVILLVAYAAFLFYRIVRLLLALRSASLLRQRASARDLPEPVARAWQRSRTAIAAPQAQLLWSNEIASPMMLGIWRKTILLPESMLLEPSGEVLATALGHELGHAARNDFARNLLYEILALPISYHPAARLALRGIRQTRELACDELVTRILISPGDYARSVVAIAAQISGCPQPACSVGVLDGDILEERIRRLTQPGPRPRHPHLALAAGFAALAVAAIGASNLALSVHAQEQAVPAANADVPLLRQAVAQDPNNNTLRLRLAEAILSKVQPGKDDPALNEVRDQCLQVLARDPANRGAYRGLATVSILQKHYADVTMWANQLLKVDPNSMTGLYDIGFAAWSTVYPNVMQARKSAGLALADQSVIADASVSAALRASYGATLDDGIAKLSQAIANDPDFSDAMAYVNLLYRLKAYIAQTPEDNAALIAEANRWVTEALAAKKRVTQYPAASAPQSQSMMLAEVTRNFPIVDVARDGATYLNGKPINANQLAGAIKQRWGQPKSVYLRADKEAIDDVVSQVRTILGNAGLQVNLGVNLAPPPPPPPPRK